LAEKIDKYALSIFWFNSLKDFIEKLLGIEIIIIIILWGRASFIKVRLSFTWFRKKIFKISAGLV